MEKQAAPRILLVPCSSSSTRPWALPGDGLSSRHRLDLPAAAFGIGWRGSHAVRGGRRIPTQSGGTRRTCLACAWPCEDKRGVGTHRPHRRKLLRHSSAPSHRHRIRTVRRVSPERPKGVAEYSPGRKPWVHTRPHPPALEEGDRTQRRMGCKRPECHAMCQRSAALPGLCGWGGAGPTACAVG